MLKTKMIFSFATMLLVLALILPVIVVAEDVTVTKTASSQIKIGENLKVSIVIRNNLNQQITATVKETIVNAQPIEPKLVIPELTAGIKAAIPPYFEWKVTIGPNSQESVSYTIKPNKVGTYAFSPTSVTLNDGKIFLSNALSTEVLCNSNNVCETEIGENYLTCSNDCKSGSKDNVCNPARDDICDPDCSAGVDLDCSQPQQKSDNGMFLIIGIGAIIIAIGIFFIRRKPHAEHRKKIKHK